MAVVVVTVREDYTGVVVGGPDSFAAHHVEPLYDPAPKTLINFLIETRGVEQSVRDLQDQLDNLEYSKQAKVIAKNAAIEMRHHRLVELAVIGFFATSICCVLATNEVNDKVAAGVAVFAMWTYCAYRLHQYVEDRWPNGPWG